MPQCEETDDAAAGRRFSTTSVAFPPPHFSSAYHWTGEKWRHASTADNGPQGLDPIWVGLHLVAKTAPKGRFSYGKWWRIRDSNP